MRVNLRVKLKHFTKFEDMTDALAGNYHLFNILYLSLELGHYSNNSCY